MEVHEKRRQERSPGQIIQMPLGRKEELKERPVDRLKHLAKRVRGGSKFFAMFFSLIKEGPEDSYIITDVVGLNLTVMEARIMMLKLLENELFRYVINEDPFVRKALAGVSNKPIIVLPFTSEV